MLQYPCHYCRQREAVVILDKFAACRKCEREGRTHDKCRPDMCGVAASKAPTPKEG